MRELLPQIDRWHNDDRAIALATVVSAWGSSPRPVGSKMVVSSTGEMAGSVSGGCVEAALVEEASAVLDALAPRLVAYGVSDETAWSVGLSCGGAIEIFLEPLEPTSTLFRRLVERLESRRTTAVATVVDGSAVGSKLLLGPDGEILLGTSGVPALDRQITSWSTAAARRRHSDRRRFGTDDDFHDVFIDLHLPPPELIVVGAVHVAVHLLAFAKRLGFRTIVIDPRTAFATRERFSDADELIREWPQDALENLRIHDSTCLAFLSHDPKIDLPGLEIALASPALYVGALGSRATHAKRVAALRDRGLPDAAIARLHAPIGLDLGGRQAEEIALAVMAEIVAVQHGRRSSPRRLTSFKA